MNFRKLRRRDEPEINLIAFIDILLIIVIFLMVTTTYNKATALQLTLPTAQASGANTAPLEIQVLVDAQGEYAINNTRVAAKDANALAQSLQQAVDTGAPNATEPLIVINADQAATHQSVIKILEAARIAGFDKITFAARAPQ